MPASALLTMSGEADHLLDAARAVGVANRRGEQAGGERDPLLAGVRPPRAGVGRVLLRLQRGAGRLERAPQRGRALLLVPAAAVAQREPAGDRGATEAAQILVEIQKPPLVKPPAVPAFAPTNSRRPESRLPL